MRRRNLLGVAGVASFVALWALASVTGLADPRHLPTPWQVVGAFGELLIDAGFWASLGETATAWLLGLAIAAVSAVVLGFVIGSSRLLRRLTNTLVELLRPVPAVALIPLAVLLFGLQIEATIMLVVYGCIWPVYVQVLYGVADVDAVAEQTARSYRFGVLARFRYLVWPTTLPYLMTGLRLSSTVGLVLAITAELIIGSPGLGFEIAVSQSGGAIARMYALVVVAGLLGTATNIVMRLVERKSLAWHPSIRSEVNA
ncbi:ABC transporter permease [Microbacterium caowuchunii]|nr:ABC transporter permease [Microbacterium caowuchunii]